MAPKAETPSKTERPIFPPSQSKVVLTWSRCLSVLYLPRPFPILHDQQPLITICSPTVHSWAGWPGWRSVLIACQNTVRKSNATATKRARWTAGDLSVPQFPRLSALLPTQFVVWKTISYLNGHYPRLRRMQLKQRGPDLSRSRTYTRRTFI